MKKVSAILLVIAIVCTSAVALTGCSTAKAALAEKPAAQDSIQLLTVSDTSVQQGDEVHSNYRSNSEIYRHLYDTITNSGANGYLICRISGSSAYQLVLSYGSCEADRYYDVYTIGDTELTYLGQLGGSHTTAYIDDTMGTLWLFEAHMGCYAYGPVGVDGGLRVDYIEQGTVEAGESYPALTGYEVAFLPTYDLSGISVF